MAKSRRSGRTGGYGRRGDAPAAPEALDFAEPERPSRARSRSGGGGSGGGGPSTIGLIIPLSVTVIAAVFLILTGVITAGKAKSGMRDVLDRTGVAAAQSLAATPVDWWSGSFGTGSWFQDFLAQKKNAVKYKAEKEGADSRWPEYVDKKFQEFIDEMGLKEDSTAKARNELVNAENRQRLPALVAGQNPTILYAQIVSGGRAIAATGNANVQHSQDAREIDGVQVAGATVNGYPARLFKAPMKSAIGEKDQGEVWVYLSEKPVYDASGGLTGAWAIMAVIGILLVAAVAFGLCLVASKGVRRVAGDLEQVSRGDLDVRIKTGGGGEAAAVARAADRAMRTFRAVQEQSITAATVQPAAPVAAEAMDTSTLLPSEPPRVDGFEIEAVHKPAALGANDYYDYFTVDATHIGVVIADMPQEGPAGAFTASTFRALMRAYAPEETSPAAVLSRVNRIMANELKRGDHITAMYAVIDTDKGIVSVASAGHLPMIFWKLEKKGSALLNPEGIAIGLDKGPVFEKTVVDKRIKLERGDRIVLYTDGPVAAESAGGEEFGEQRFYYLVSREAPKNSAAFVNFVANEVDLFHEGAPQKDDITLVTVRKTKE